MIFYYNLYKYTFSQMINSNFSRYFWSNSPRSI